VPRQINIATNLKHRDTAKPAKTDTAKSVTKHELKILGRLNRDRMNLDDRLVNNSG